MTNETDMSLFVFGDQIQMDLDALKMRNACHAFDLLEDALSLHSEGHSKARGQGDPRLAPVISINRQEEV